MPDLVVVGGGPVGLATAIHAARRGLAAVVIERRELPLDKACGEGLMPAGAAALAAIGAEPDAAARLPFRGIRYVGGGGAAEARFRGAPGLAVRRTALVEALARRATSLGVELRYGCGADRWRLEGRREVMVDTAGGAVRGRLLVGADGLHSRVRERAGLALARGGPLRYGVRRHFHLEPWSELVEVHWSEAGEAYLTPVGPRLVGLAVLWSGGGRFPDILGRFPLLAERLAGAEPASNVLGAGPLRQRVRRRFADRVALVGDAAGSVDALTGEGLALGLECAGALADVVARGRPLTEYERAYRRLSRRYYLGTRLLLEVAGRRALRRRLVPLLAARPALFDSLLAFVAGGVAAGGDRGGITAPTDVTAGAARPAPAGRGARRTLPGARSPAGAG